MTWHSRFPGRPAHRRGCGGRGASTAVPSTSRFPTAPILFYPGTQAPHTNRDVRFQERLMPYQRYAVVQHKLELWSQALAENIEEVPHLKEPLAKLIALLALLKELTVEQARLTARR